MAILQTMPTVESTSEMCKQDFILGPCLLRWTCCPSETDSLLSCVWLTNCFHSKTVGWCEGPVIFVIVSPPFLESAALSLRYFLSVTFKSQFYSCETKGPGDFLSLGSRFWWGCWCLLHDINSVSIPVFKGFWGQNQVSTELRSRWFPTFYRPCF